MFIRCKTGIKGFDDLIQGGLPKGRVFVVCGPPGSGKTLFGIQFLVSGADFGERGLFVSLNNTAKYILEDMSGFSLGLEKHVQARRIFFIDFFPKIKYEYIDRFGSRPSEDIQPPSPAVVFQEIENFVIKENVTRVVVDSISQIKFVASSPETADREISRFIQHLSDLNITTVLLSEMVDPTVYATEHYLAHGVIFLHNFLNEKTMIRAIQIIKMRGTKHDCNMRELAITESGLVVSNPLC